MMNKSVNLYLASGVVDGIGFWIVNFTDEDDIIKSGESKLLECYRKELFGIQAAIDVKEAINTTLDILEFELQIDTYKFDNYNKTHTSEIPLNIVEDAYDLWAYNYDDDILWKKYIGLLNFRRKMKKRNNYINKGLKGKVYEFAIKLDKILSYSPVDYSLRIDRSNQLMW